MPSKAARASRHSFLRTWTLAMATSTLLRYGSAFVLTTFPPPPFLSPVLTISTRIRYKASKHRCGLPGSVYRRDVAARMVTVMSTQRGRPPTLLFRAEVSSLVALLFASFSVSLSSSSSSSSSSRLSRSTSRARSTVFRSRRYAVSRRRSSSLVSDCSVCSSSSCAVFESPLPPPPPPPAEEEADAAAATGSSPLRMRYHRPCGLVRPWRRSPVMARTSTQALRPARVLARCIPVSFRGSGGGCRMGDGD
mmetsp:Transcript_25187/g.72847  ORF Transcript_25187/g.72847 Transcript_25187/m.72847 type:complete len:250 (+) Transcript_25187:1558-2307(+)